MFCERCVPLTHCLSRDPTARPHPELMSGSCIWDDEICRRWCIRCMHRTRLLFHARYCMTVGDPIRPEAQSLWDQAAVEFPDWPIFLPERRSSGIAGEVRRLVDERNERELGALEAMMDEENEPPDPSPRPDQDTATGLRWLLRIFGGRSR